MKRELRIVIVGMFMTIFFYNCGSTCAMAIYIVYIELTKYAYIIMNIGWVGIDMVIIIYFMLKACIPKCQT